MILHACKHRKHVLLPRAGAVLHLDSAAFTSFESHVLVRKGITYLCPVISITLSYLGQTLMGAYNYARSLQ